MKKLMSITVHGNEKDWSFQFEGDDEFLDDWRDDGLEVDEVLWEVGI